jgi:hypothetical protein
MARVAGTPVKKYLAVSTEQQPRLTRSHPNIRPAQTCAKHAAPSPRRRRSTLELRFSDVLELNPAAAAALAGPGARLAALRLINVSAPEGLDLRLLAAALAPLRALTLVQRSKVAPLLAGDAALEALAGMSGLEELELQGRMCGVGDGGLLALRRLTRLRRLVVGWVPWQSQISQVCVSGGGHRTPGAARCCKAVASACPFPCMLKL